MRGDSTRSRVVLRLDHNHSRRRLRPGFPSRATLRAHRAPISSGLQTCKGIPTRRTLPRPSHSRGGVSQIDPNPRETCKQERYGHHDEHRGKRREEHHRNDHRTIKKGQYDQRTGNEDEYCYGPQRPPKPKHSSAAARRVSPPPADAGVLAAIIGIGKSQRQHRGFVGSTREDA